MDSIYFNVVHRKVEWRSPELKSLNSLPGKELQQLSNLLLVLMPNCQFLHITDAWIFEWLSDCFAVLLLERGIVGIPQI